MEKQELRAFTVRLSKETADRFNNLRDRSSKTIREIGEEAIKEWIERQEDPDARHISADNARDIEVSLQENLVAAVIEHLRTSSDWAQAVLKAAGLYDPVFSVYMQRKHHFRLEKQVLSERFVPWLVDRMLAYVRQSRQVCLVVESGTTLKETLDFLGPALMERESVLRTLEPEQLQIVTNNFPGAESYRGLRKGQQDR